MAKLYAELTSDKNSKKLGKGGDDFVNLELTVKGRYVGSIELQLLNDMADGVEKDEYLVKFYRNEEEDPKIIAQGNI